MLTCPKTSNIHIYIFSAAGARVKFGGLTDVEIGGVSGFENELVCSFKLATDVVWGGVW